MSRVTTVGQRLDALIAAYVDVPVPEPRGLPWYLSPLPEWLENVCLRLVWPIMLANLVGTAFGFVYYWPQLSETPVVMWPIVPVSPLATLYIALSLAAWRLGYGGRPAQLLHLLACFGCLKYGLWSVFVQLFVEDASVIPLPLWLFLVVSHAAMALEAFLVQRYAAFPLWAVGAATGWFVLNDVLDYFVAVLGGPYHTWLNVLWVGGRIDRTLPAFEYMAASAVACTALAALLALRTWRVLSTGRAGER
jgi:uncharacterized membrane protein YpjA